MLFKHCILIKSGDFNMNIITISPNSLVIPENFDLRRINARPDEFIDPTYMDKYDNTSIFYDIFESNNKIYLIGPPLLNLSPIINSCYIIFDNGREEKVSINSKLLERGQLSWIDLKEIKYKPVSLRFDFSIFSISYKGNKNVIVDIGKDVNDEFNDAKSLMTLQLNNKLEWIHDWAKYYNKVHDVDTIVIYDNNSTNYKLDDISNSLLSITNLKNIVVVPWNFKYGPQGKPWTGPNTPWDSDFCQIGALQHMRFRFSLKSKGFINADIDELIIPLKEVNIFDALENSEVGVIGVEGNTIEGHLSNHMMKAEGVPHFYHFWERKVHISGGTRKWAGSPSKWDDETVQTTAHWVRGISYKADSRFSIGHFRQINDGWKIQSRTIEYSGKDILRPDFSLIGAMSVAFPNEIPNILLVNALKDAEQRIQLLEKGKEDEYSKLQSYIKLLTHERIVWDKIWIWKGNVLVFETRCSLGKIAFDIVISNNNVQLNVSVRDTKYQEDFFEVVFRYLGTDFSILSNGKGLKAYSLKRENISFEEIATLISKKIFLFVNIR